MRRLDLPPVWTVALALAAWALARAAPVAPSPLPGILGPLAIVLGFALILWSAIRFHRRSTPIEPRHAPKALITEGPYRINRNPIYTGLVLCLLGWAIQLGALSALLPALALPWVLTERFVKGEEAALRAAFGAEADAWIARTRRW